MVRKRKGHQKGDYSKRGTGPRKRNRAKNRPLIGNSFGFNKAKTGTDYFSRQLGKRGEKGRTSSEVEPGNNSEIYGDR